MLDDRLLEQHRLAAGAVEGGDRHTPHALAGERPVGPVCDHVEDALLAPGGDPAHVASNGLQRARAETLLVEGHEPLLGGTEERRVLAAPAVRIGMVEGHLGHQSTPGAEEVDDLGVRLPDRQPRKVLHLGDEPSVVVHGVVDLEAEGPSELVFLLAVAGSDVDEPGAGVHGDEVCSCDLSATIDPGVPVGAPHIVRAVQPHRDRCDLDGALRSSLQDALIVLEPRAGHDVDLTGHVECDIALRGLHRDREIRRQGPWRGRPDHGKRVAPLELGREGRRHGLEGEFHVHRWRALLLVLDLRLGERGLAVHAPVNRLQALVDETALAQAEVEYEEQRAPSVYVKFPLVTPHPEVPDAPKQSVVVWTTTPWTLPANLAVAVNPHARYVALDVAGDTLFVAEDLVDD